ncbi:MAG: hypothetical protein CVU48_07310 [Candidatus Cloacimonetes bacterium HGW-Cloacimonetes-1]|jgi:formylglycine-generating enzyme required for sulfatase activity|nr:MAG: hypothetical protein CVU48_07310 [Candidatus Cloacimonetes bacterium HGW-Cloacimonetes-1]
MPYCLACGKQIPERAKFCPICGEKTAFDELKADETTAIVETPAVVHDHHKNDANSTFTLLDAGQKFEGFTVLKGLNKDFEGIKYIVTKDGQPDHKYLLKIFHNAYFDNIEKLFNLQMRLTKIHTLVCPNTPRVLEINQHNVPRYMLVEYVQGVSIHQIKLQQPARMNEEYIRSFAKQLISGAICIREHGLSVHELTAVGVLIDDKDVLKILSSGIVFDGTDEREDIFALGVILAQMLCKSGLYQTIYCDARLRQTKFAEISEVSHSMNKFLAECLHRNVNQRFHSLKDMQKEFERLTPLKEDVLIKSREQTLDKLEPLNEVEAPPKFRGEYGFWTLIIVVSLLIMSLFTTNVYSYLFGDRDVEFQFKAFSAKPDSTKFETTAAMNEAATKVESSSPLTNTGYGSFRTGDNKTNPTVTNDYRQNLATKPDNTEPSKAPSSKNNLSPGYIFIASDTYGFGRLKENLHHNVSVSGFYISRYEVTQGEWNQLMRPANVSLRGDNLPVDNVSWMDIAIYANGKSEAEGLTPCYRIRGLGKSRVVTCDFRANGYRLPTEVEWELAAKGGELFDYSGSDQIAEIAWYKDNSAAKIHSPGQKDPNSDKLYDMTGNVSEWCWDWYDVNYPRNLSIFVNPTGPETGTMKTIRGGNITNGEGRNLNVLFRDRGDPSRGYHFVGFRLVRAAQ